MLSFTQEYSQSFINNQILKFTFIKPLACLCNKREHIYCDNTDIIPHTYIRDDVLFTSTIVFTMTVVELLL